MGMESSFQRVAIASFRVKPCGHRPIPCFLAPSPWRRSLSTLRAVKQNPPPAKKPKIQSLPTRYTQSGISSPKPAYESPPRKPHKTPPRHSNDPPPPATNHLKHRTIPILLGGLTIFVFSTYGTYTYIKVRRAVSDLPIPSTPESQFDVSSRYNDIAPTFDSSVDWTESIMGLTRLRKKLAQQARGDVLEVAVGTGRNLEFYEWDFKRTGRGGKDKGTVRSFTAVDKSLEMLEIAHEKFTKIFPGILGVRWIMADAGENGKIPGPPRNANERSGNIEGGKYDTVIETMGLCSVSNPVTYLRNLGELAKEDEGRILLLEHGRGQWEWLNKLLDKFAEKHAHEFGCWWNRDLGSIVEESGLEVVEIRRPWSHGGTTWWIELRRPKTTKVDAKQVDEKSTML